MRRRLSAQVKTQLEKAREAAILAVDVYNKPATRFRAGGYIVFMCIAWTALFHAIFFKQKIKPYYKGDNGRYLKVEGDYKAWELAKCARQYYKGKEAAITWNLDFIVGLRNKVEHRSMPALDTQVFGECQAMLFNFEDLLVEEFGSDHGLTDSLTLAIQFSQFRHLNQGQAIRSLHKPIAKDVAGYIANFRSMLTSEVLNDLQYSYKVYLIPKIANNAGRSTIAVEYVPFDPSNSAEMENYEKVVALLKPQHIQVANAGKLKPAEICKYVEPIVKKVVGPDAKFNASYHHARACDFYGVRPPKGAANPAKTRVEYCQYDSAHKDYVFTEAWKDFLIEEMEKPGQYDAVRKSSARTSQSSTLSSALPTLAKAV